MCRVQISNSQLNTMLYFSWICALLQTDKKTINKDVILNWINKNIKNMYGTSGGAIHINIMPEIALSRLNMLADNTLEVCSMGYYQYFI